VPWFRCDGDVLEVQIHAQCRVSSSFFDLFLDDETEVTVRVVNARSPFGPSTSCFGRDARRVASDAERCTRGRVADDLAGSVDDGRRPLDRSRQRLVLATFVSFTLFVTFVSFIFFAAFVSLFSVRFTVLTLAGG
jgi:hypothetical protein